MPGNGTELISPNSGVVPPESILDKISYNDLFVSKFEEPSDDLITFPSDNGSTVNRSGKTIAAILAGSEDERSFVVSRHAHSKVSEVDASASTRCLEKMEWFPTEGCAAWRALIVQGTISRV